MIIGISGKKGSGKDTVGLIISYLRYRVDYANYCKKNNMANNLLSYDKIQFFNNFCVNYKNYTADQFKYWEIKKYATKMKQVVSLLTGATLEQLEDRDFKENYYYHFLTGEIRHVDKLNHENHVLVYSITDYQRQLYREDFDFWVNFRLVLQIEGTDIGRKQRGENIWVNALMTDYTYSCDSQFCLGTCPKDCDEDAEPTFNWLITDVRFPNEVEAIKDRNGLVIRLERDDKRTSAAWQKKFPDVAVYDPDGWNRKNWKYSWEEELITLEEYKSRLSRSTCICKGSIGASWSDYVKLDEHPSETALDDHKDFDYTIDNDGTIEELIEKVKTILEKENLL